MTRLYSTLVILFCLVGLSGAAGCRTENIGAVQGTGAQSPVMGQVVVVDGIVIGGSMERLGGVFVQGERDGDGATSDGVFVVPADGADVPPRLSHVKVVGKVTEIGEGPATLTALTEARFQVIGTAPAPAAMVLDQPPADWEPYEGMLVTVSAPLTVSGTYGLARFGEIVASFGGRLYSPTELAAPGEGATRAARANAGRRILLDDMDVRPLSGMPWFIETGIDATRPLRTGSVIRTVTGVVDQRRGVFRLQLAESLVGQVDQAPRPAPPTVSGDARIASFNVLNLFNGDGTGGGFPTDRGAESLVAYERQRDKLVAVVQAMTPDVATLQEIENDGYGPESSLAQFVEALNAAGPITDWTFVDAGEGPGTDAIRVAIVYRASRVEPVGRPATLVEGPFAFRSRAPLAAAFRHQSGPPFTVVANHFKSKGCGRGDDAATGEDVDQKDGQSCFNATRVESARLLDAWLKSDPAGSGTDLSILLGDFNAHSMEDPVGLLRASGWIDALEAFGVEQAYSYVFAGEAGRLDHVLLSEGLAGRLRGAAEWHANADEMELFGYAGGVHDGPYRSSDHDPLVIGLDLAR